MQIAVILGDYISLEAVVKLSLLGLSYISDTLCMQIAWPSKSSPR